MEAKQIINNLKCVQWKKLVFLVTLEVNTAKQDMLYIYNDSLHSSRKTFALIWRVYDLLKCSRQCEWEISRCIPSEKGMILSLPTTLPDLSRKRSGQNCCGSCQSSGSMCALYRFTITCISNYCSDHDITSVIIVKRWWTTVHWARLTRYQK